MTRVVLEAWDRSAGHAGAVDSLLEHRAPIPRPPEESGLFAFLARVALHSSHPHSMGLTRRRSNENPTRCDARCIEPFDGDRDRRSRTHHPSSTGQVRRGRRGLACWSALAPRHRGDRRALRVAGEAVRGLRRPPRAHDLRRGAHHRDRRRGRSVLIRDRLRHLHVKSVLEHTCPRCEGGIPNSSERGAYSGAISRIDNHTEICTSCGIEEAFRDHFAGRSI